MVKIGFEIPKKMLKAAQEPDISKRPYDLCLECPFISETCDGPNCLAMTNDRWVKWATSRMAHLRMTRERLSELSGIPHGTINSIFQNKTQDMRHSTIRELTRILIGGCWGQYPCHFASILINGNALEDERRYEELEAELSRTSAALEHVSNEANMLRDRLVSYDDTKKTDIDALRADYQRRVDYLKQDVERFEKQIQFKDAQIVNKDKQIRRKELTLSVLSIFIAAIGLGIIGVLIYDKLTPDAGWFRAMAALAEGLLWIG